MEKVQSFRDLRVWQLAMGLVPAVYQLLRRFPREETFALASQIRRAVVSVPANLAEGRSRQHTKEYVQHLSIARGGLAELLTLLLVAERLGCLQKQEVEDIEQKVSDVRMPLSTLIARLQRKLPASWVRFRSLPDPGPPTPDPSHRQAGRCRPAPPDPNPHHCRFVSG